MQRLNNAKLSPLPGHIAKPRYDRARVTSGIVHLGIGNFHRAHQAVYTDDALASGERDWGIIGASLRKPDIHEALIPQDGLYTLGVKSGTRTDWRVVGAIQSVLYAPDDPQALINAIAAPSTRIVSLTITEKAYCLHAGNGSLDEDHPDIRHDRLHASRPVSALGYLYAGLKARRDAELPLPTLLSCDNLPSNGKKLRAALIRFAKLADHDFTRVLDDQLHCPSTMVDRIVPQTTDEDRDAVRLALGFDDAWPVMTEPFTQWVIEDEFSLDRPNWHRSGAQFVSDIAPYERMKLSLLNASHTALAFLGSYAGYETVSDAMQDKAIRKFIECFMREDIAPVLKLTDSMNVEAYITSLIHRFDNPALHHRLEQIASDSSQKIPQRLMGTIRTRLAIGLPLGRFADAIAAFILYLEGHDQNGRALLFRDPQAETLIKAIREAGKNSSERVKALFSKTEIFGDLSSHERAIQDVASALDELQSNTSARPNRS